MLSLKHNEHVVTIENEPSDLYSHNNSGPHHYGSQHILGEARFLVSTAHGVRYGEPEPLNSCLILASGGATTVHQQSALLHGNRCIVAVSAYLVCLQLPDLQMIWHTQVDDATCFGVYHVPKYESYISHGELDIARITYDGEILWSSGGKDILTNGFTLFDDYAEVMDFNNERYRIDLLSGRSQLIS